MSDHFFVAADHAHLRVYLQRQFPGQHTADLDPVQALDFPGGRNSYTARDTSMAGRFQSSQYQSPSAPTGVPSARNGMSIDERLPLQREEERRRVRDVAHEIETFFAGRNDATWDLAITPAMQGAVVEQLSRRVRGQLRRVIAKDLVNQRPEDIRAHFVGSGNP